MRQYGRGTVPKDCNECAAGIAGWNRQARCGNGCFFTSDNGAAALRWLEFLACRDTDGISGNVTFRESRLSYLYGATIETPDERFGRLTAMQQICDVINGIRNTERGARSRGT